MSTQPSANFSTFVRWLRDHAGFPSIRLPAEAERLLLVAVAAEEAPPAATGSRESLAAGSAAQKAAQRTHALRRSQVHFKCDNSAKV